MIAALVVFVIAFVVSSAMVVIVLATAGAKPPAPSERARIEREAARAAWQLDQARHRAIEEMLNEVRRQQDQGGSYR